MKIKSSAGKDIFFEAWNTPVMQSEQLWLLRQFFTGSQVHFFFQMNHDSKDEFYVLSVSGGSPFRITEEGLGWTYVGKYIESETPSKKKEKKCSTFRIWNTSFAKNTYSARPLKEDERVSEDIFQYLIITQDEWVEFISLTPPKWEIHKNVKLEKLVLKYMKESL
jgi:hypothetical protein